jgi:hypothetical protein
MNANFRCETILFPEFNCGSMLRGARVQALGTPMRLRVTARPRQSRDILPQALRKHGAINVMRRLA